MDKKKRCHGYSMTTTIWLDGFPNDCTKRSIVMASAIWLDVFFQREHLKIAQQYFQLVGGSASECGKSTIFYVCLAEGTSQDRPAVPTVGRGIR